MPARLREKKKLELLKLPGVSGVGVKDDIIVYVEDPAAMAYVPNEVDGVRIRKIPAKFIAFSIKIFGGLALGALTTYGMLASAIGQALKSRTSRIRPVVAGVSIGHYKVTAGTLTGYAEYNGEIVGLSCNHVIALNYLSIRIGVKGDSILQPGPHDGGRPDRDTIGYLEKWDSLENEAHTDSAIFRLAENVEHKPDEIYGVGKPREVTEPRPGMEVVKSGRTTGVTYGVIESIDASIKMYYTETEYAILHEQIVAYSPATISAPGDSGSWVGDTVFHRTVGMLIGGSVDYKRAVITPMKKIERRLGIKFIAPPVTGSEALLGTLSFTLSLATTIYGVHAAGGKREHH